jgi:hypothetical protein
MFESSGMIFVKKESSSFVVLEKLLALVWLVGNPPGISWVLIEYSSPRNEKCISCLPP